MWVSGRQWDPAMVSFTVVDLPEDEKGDDSQIGSAVASHEIAFQLAGLLGGSIFELIMCRFRHASVLQMCGVWLCLALNVHGPGAFIREL